MGSGPRIPHLEAATCIVRLGKHLAHSFMSNFCLHGIVGDRIAMLLVSKRVILKGTIEILSDPQKPFLGESEMNLAINRQLPFFNLDAASHECLVSEN